MALFASARLGASLKVSSGFNIGVDDGRSITVTATGGTLHGSWLADDQLSTSDRRLKADITELVCGLHTGGAQDGPQPHGALPRVCQKTAKRFPVGSVLRQLRPVAYRLKDADHGNVRFGFLADELQSALPQVVREVQNARGEDQKAVVYQDLIAVLAAGLKEHQAKLEAEVDNWRQQAKTLEERVEILEHGLEAERNAQRRSEHAISMLDRRLASATKPARIKMLARSAVAHPRTCRCQ